MPPAPFLKREHLVLSFQSLLRFIANSYRTKEISHGMAHRMEKEVHKLMDSLAKDKISLEKGVDEINSLILKLNQILTSHQVVYPPFNYDTMPQLAAGQIFAFQHFLRGEIGILPLELEEQYFTDAADLWHKVFKGTIPPRIGIQKLTTLIRNVNLTLPQEEHYPLPEERDYHL